mgnify:CR=1 FL=1
MKGVIACITGCEEEMRKRELYLHPPRSPERPSSSSHPSSSGIPIGN